MYRQWNPIVLGPSAFVSHAAAALSLRRRPLRLPWSNFTPELPVSLRLPWSNFHAGGVTDQ